MTWPDMPHTMPVSILLIFLMNSQNLASLRLILFSMVDVACGVLVCAYGQVCFWLLASNRQAQKLRCELFRAVLKQEIGWFDTHEIGELNNRLSE